MDSETKNTWLKRALLVFGVIFLGVYPIGFIWPSGWVWHGGDGQYYLQMIAGVYLVLGIFMIRASRDPQSNRSLISFTIWSSAAHSVIMGFQVMNDSRELGHLLGDVPALLLVAVVLGYLGSGAPARAPSAV